MLHVGDTATIEITLYDENGAPLDLTNAVECYLYIQRSNTILKRTCTIKPPATAGVITYKLTSEDFSIGDIDYVFQPVVIFQNGDRFTGTRIAERVVSTLEQKANR